MSLVGSSILKCSKYEKNIFFYIHLKKFAGGLLMDDINKILCN